MLDILQTAVTAARMTTGDAFSSQLDAKGDRDWVRIDLTGGTAVQIDLRGSGLDPVDDPFLRLYNATARLVAQNDDGGPGRNAQLTFAVPVDGTYYIEAASFVDAGTGTYQIKAQLTRGTNTVTTAPHALNFVPTPDVPGPGPLRAIVGEAALAASVVRVYFGTRGENFDGEITGEGFNAYEKAQFRAAFDQIEVVADLTFQIVTDAASADFRLVRDTNEMAPNTLGYFYSPGLGDAAGVGVFNGSNLDRSAGGNLEAGGRGYATILHEVMHGLGLMHPHDDSGGSAVMWGVTTEFDDYGTAGLNQGVYTAMSYNPGHQTGDAPYTEDFGFEAGPMALDIAALQLIYGAVGHRSGNSFYLLDADNNSGTGWQAIWDTGGIDTIVHKGTAAATINLRAATLGYENGGGGFVSSVEGVTGGYTIAAGVTIENAKGGSGGDRMVGNGAGNVLDGRGGNDVIFGLDGDDILKGGNLRDTLIGGTGGDILLGQQGNDWLQGDLGADRLLGGSGYDTFVFARFDDSKVEAPQRDVIMDFQRGFDQIDLSGIDGHRGLRGDQAFNFVGSAGFDRRDGQGDVRTQGLGNGVVAAVDINGDGRGDMLIEVQHVASLSAADFIL